MFKPNNYKQLQTMGLKMYKQLSISMPDDLREKLNQISKKEQRSVSLLVQILLRKAVAEFYTQEIQNDGSEQQN